MSDTRQQPAGQYIILLCVLFDIYSESARLNLCVPRVVSNGGRRILLIRLIMSFMHQRNHEIFWRTIKRVTDPDGLLFQACGPRQIPFKLWIISSLLSRCAHGESSQQRECLQENIYTLYRNKNTRRSSLPRQQSASWVISF